jgi:hypothetical protein
MYRVQSILLEDDGGKENVKQLLQVFTTNVLDPDSSSVRVIKSRDMLLTSKINVYWALDPAKINRDLFVARGEPDITELIQTARDICSHDAASLA